MNYNKIEIQTLIVKIMVIQELFKLKNRMIGKVVKIEKNDNQFEGIKQDCYCLDIIDDEGDQYKEQIPCIQNILNEFNNEIKRLLPETKDLQDQDDIMNILKGKRFLWVKRQFGSQLIDIQPIHYFFPSKLSEDDEQNIDEIIHKYKSQLPDIIDQFKKENKIQIHDESFKEGYIQGVKDYLKEKTKR